MKKDIEAKIDQIIVVAKSWYYKPVFRFGNEVYSVAEARQALIDNAEADIGDRYNGDIDAWADATLNCSCEGALDGDDLVNEISRAFASAVKLSHDGISGIEVYVSNDGDIDFGSNAQSNYGVGILDADSYGITNAELSCEELRDVCENQVRMDFSEIKHKYDAALEKINE